MSPMPKVRASSVAIGTTWRRTPSAITEKELKKRHYYGSKYALNYLEWCPHEDMNSFWSAIANSKLDGFVQPETKPVPNDLPFPVINVNDFPEQYCNSNWVVSDNYNVAN